MFLNTHNENLTVLPAKSFMSEQNRCKSVGVKMELIKLPYRYL